MACKLMFGKRPHVVDKRDFKLSRYLNKEALPPLPAEFGHENLVTDWQMLLNDQIGDCGPAAAIHQEMVTTAEGVGKPTVFTNKNALKVYEDVGGYNPNDPNTDQGVDLRDLLKYWQKTGVPDSKNQRHKIAAYLALDLSNQEEMLYALYLFGAVLLGVQFPQSAMDQFNNGEPWSVVDKNSPILGGHAISLVAKRNNLEVVTWGQLQEMETGFFATYGDEAWAVLSEEILNGQGKSPEGFDWQQLQQDLQDIQNVSPTPEPTPSPNPTPDPTPTPDPAGHTMVINIDDPNVLIDGVQADVKAQITLTWGNGTQKHKVAEGVKDN